jgi:predicted ester cyclase
MSVVDAMVEAITNEDIDMYGRLYADDAVMFEPLLPEPARGRTEIMRGEAALFAAFSDVTIEVTNQLSSGPVVMAEVVLSATNDGPLDLGAGEVPPTGRRIEIPMAWAFDLNNEGLVVEERDYFDTGQIMEQLGMG